MKIAVLQFGGSNCDYDVQYVLMRSLEWILILYGIKMS